MAFTCTTNIRLEDLEVGMVIHNRIDTNGCRHWLVIGAWEEDPMFGRIGARLVEMLEDGKYGAVMRAYKDTLHQFHAGA